MDLSFLITSSHPISIEFLKRGISDFESAADFVRNLPYGRNANKLRLETLFIDGCGTCSTKNALLKQLAMENNQEDVKLIIGLFKMNAINTPEIKSTLEHYQLDYIPEAHCYLKFQNQIIDCTKQNSKPSDFIDDLIEETEIYPIQITDFKVNYHKNYLLSWLQETEQTPYTLNELWSIREKCIQNLTDY